MLFSHNCYKTCTKIKFPFSQLCVIFILMLFKETIICVFSMTNAWRKQTTTIDNNLVQRDSWHWRRAIVIQYNYLKNSLESLMPFSMTESISYMIAFISHKMQRVGFLFLKALRFSLGKIFHLLQLYFHEIKVFTEMRNLHLVIHSPFDSTPEVDFKKAMFQLL